MLHFSPAIICCLQKLQTFYDKVDFPEAERNCLKKEVGNTIEEFRREISEKKLLSTLLSPINISRGIIALLEPVLPEVNALIGQYYPGQSIEVYDSLQETIAKPQYVCLEVEPESVSFLSGIRLLLTFRQKAPVPDLLIRETAELFQRQLASFDNTSWPVPDEYLSLPEGHKLPVVGIGIIDKNIKFLALPDQKTKVAEFRLTNCSFAERRGCAMM